MYYMCIAIFSIVFIANQLLHWNDENIICIFIATITKTYYLSIREYIIIALNI